MCCGRTRRVPRRLHVAQTDRPALSHHLLRRIGQPALAREKGACARSRRRGDHRPRFLPRSRGGALRRRQARHRGRARGGALKHARGKAHPPAGLLRRHGKRDALRADAAGRHRAPEPQPLHGEPPARRGLSRGLGDRHGALSRSGDHRAAARGAGAARARRDPQHPRGRGGTHGQATTFPCSTISAPCARRAACPCSRICSSIGCRPTGCAK